MLIVTALCLAALAPGAATVWLVRQRHRRSWLLACLAGAAVTMSLPFLLLVSLVLFPPLGILVGACAGLAALNAFDHDRVWLGMAWALVAVLALGCAGWSM